MSVKSFVKLMFLMFYDMPTLNKVYLISSYLFISIIVKVKMQYTKSFLHYILLNLEHNKKCTKYSKYDLFSLRLLPIFYGSIGFYFLRQYFSIESALCNGHTFFKRHKQTGT